MADDNAELQQAEITALRSIYADDFIDCPPPKAWKGAARLPEFIIKVAHPDPEHALKVNCNLLTRFPKTYPTNASAQFTIQQPRGFAPDHVNRLSHAISAEAQKYRGQECVFQVADFVRDWLETHATPAAEAPGSLATQMIKRATDAEAAQRARAEAAAEEQHEKAAQVALALKAQIRAEQELREKQQQQQTRRRGMSDATAVPSEGAGDTPTEFFSGEEIVVGGVAFSTVKMFHPRREYLGTTYMAEPVCDDVTVTLPLEVHIVTFDAPYYSTTQGRKKLRQLETEIKKLIGVRHPNVLSVHALKLSTPSASGPSRLVVLSEERPSMTLLDVLEDCDSLREERATGYLNQILSGLQAIHAGELVHRGINLKSIGLSAKENGKLIKLGKVGWHVKLLDMHRSNPIGSHAPPLADDLVLPEDWLPKEAVDSPLVYTKGRDIHYVGVVFMQMLTGRDVMFKNHTIQSALQSSSVSSHLLQLAANMLGMSPLKKGTLSCSGLLTDLSRPHLGSESVRTPAITFTGPKTPGLPPSVTGSPERDYFLNGAAFRQARQSRWKEDWEELELLGRGGFGSVVKARNKIDSRTYAVKKVKLRAGQSDKKLFREVNALSRLSHRYIVRYYTTWVETSEPSDEHELGSSDSEDTTADGMTSVPVSREITQTFDFDRSGHFRPNLDDLRSSSGSGSGSFPNIRFARSRSGGPGDGSDEGSDDSGSDVELPEVNLLGANGLGVNGDGGLLIRPPRTPEPSVARTLYIQMEFVERQTLKERIAEGLSEDEGWRLFHQIVDALVHMSGLGILHRDIKLTNIFIDGRGDCKVGDFGLATSSLAAVDPSDVSPQSAISESDMTLEVGTRLYIAPEVLSPKGTRNHSKADMYSLGIVFFEMNYQFSTGSERVFVIESLRKPEVHFPNAWEQTRTRQRDIIKWLLQHEPTKRPSALELSQSPLLPSRLEDDFLKDAMRKIVKPDSPHIQVLLNSLFEQPAKLARGYLYDSEVELPEHSTLNPVVEETLIRVFELHGAIRGEPALLLPRMNTEDEHHRAAFLDKQGEIVYLANNAVVPFARLAARAGHKRIKRYYVGDIFKPNPVSGHPRTSKAAAFDIITPDTVYGPTVSMAEAIAVVNECLDVFPGLGASYDIHISHSKIIEVMMSRVPPDSRASVVDIMTQSKSTVMQKRAMLLKKGVLRSTADELEILSETDGDFDSIIYKLERVSPTLATQIAPCIDAIRATLQYAAIAGVKRPIFLHPLMFGNHNQYFKDGVCFEVVKRSRRTDVLAAGGRYDALISSFSPPNPDAAPTCATVVQISLERITAALATYQNASVKNLIRDQRSFGFWTPRRCDVYVVSFSPGHLQDRLEVAAMLWAQGISADVMYEAGVAESEDHVAQCADEGILFIVYPRPRTAKRDQPAYKVKSVLKGTEYDLSKQELVGWLQEEIAEQKRVDGTTSGVVNSLDVATSTVPAKENGTSGDLQLLLPVEVKKQLKRTKQMFTDRAFDVSSEVKSAVQTGIPTLAVDVPSAVFDAIIKSSAWITDEEAFKAVLATFSTPQPSYAQQLRDALSKRRTDGHKYTLIVSVRDERVGLMTLT